MPVVATRWAAVTNAVLATLRADPNLATTTILDGFPVTNDPLVDAVVVGSSADPEDDVAGTVTQEYHDMALASSSRMETVTLACEVWAQNGDGDLSAARTRAFLLLGYVEAALRANPSQGLTDVLRVEVVDATVHQAQTEYGAVCSVDVTVSATSLI